MKKNRNQINVSKFRNLQGSIRFSISPFSHSLRSWIGASIVYGNCTRLVTRLKKI